METITEKASDVALEFADYFDAFIGSGDKNPDDMVAGLQRQLKSEIMDVSDLIAQIRVAQVLIQNVNVNDGARAYLQVSNRLLDLSAEHLKKGLGKDVRN